MKRRSSSLLLTLGISAFGWAGFGTAQIPAPTDTIVREYRTDGMTDQPFTVEVVGTRRTVNNVLYVRLALTNRGTAPLQPRADFSTGSGAADLNRISAVYVVDPNGRRKYPVLRNTQGVPLCSRIDPPIQPGERRQLGAQFPAPPDTTSAVDLFFPQATAPVLAVPIGLPEAGEPLTDDSAIILTPSTSVVPGSAPIAPPTAIDQPTSNNQPDVYTNQTNPVVQAESQRAIGSVESANATVPFTIEALSLKPTANGQTLLRLAMTNTGSGELIATGQFNGEVAGPGDGQLITGVYLVDPTSKQRFNVLRQNGVTALCSRIDPAFSAGERRVLEASFPALPATVKSVYLYFPHATPIANVPVTR